MLCALKSAAKSLLPAWLCITRLRRAAGNAVLLTFDDGPHPETTPAVLEKLRAFRARAIFFVVGNRIERAADMLSRIRREGHWIGNHSFAHHNDRQLSLREYYQDLQLCQAAIAAHGGGSPQFHRPPHGQLTAASLLGPKACHLKTMTWSVSSEDWRLRADEAAVQRGEQLIEEVQARDILLFHDERCHTLALLDVLLPALQSRGVLLAPELDHIA